MSASQVTKADTPTVGSEAASADTTRNAPSQPDRVIDVSEEAADAPPVADESSPLASLSLDLDNQWSYMRTHGDPGWDEFPSYFDTVVPHILGFLER